MRKIRNLKTLVNKVREMMMKYLWTMILMERMKELKMIRRTKRRKRNNHKMKVFLRLMKMITKIWKTKKNRIQMMRKNQIWVRSQIWNLMLKRMANKKIFKLKRKKRRKKIVKKETWKNYKRKAIRLIARRNQI